MPKKTSAKPAIVYGPLRGYRLTGGLYVHSDCFSEATKPADAPLARRAMDALLYAWPRGAVCTVCKGRSEEPNLDSPAIRGTWIVEKWRKSTPNGRRSARNAYGDSPYGGKPRKVARSKPTAYCRLCRADKPTTAAGTFAKHHRYDADWRKVDCQNSGQPA